MSSDRWRETRHSDSRRSDSRRSDSWHRQQRDGRSRERRQSHARVVRERSQSRQVRPRSPVRHRERTVQRLPEPVQRRRATRWGSPLDSTRITRRSTPVRSDRDRVAVLSRRNEDADAESDVDFSMDPSELMYIGEEEPVVSGDSLSSLSGVEVKSAERLVTQVEVGDEDPVDPVDSLSSPTGVEVQSAGKRVIQAEGSSDQRKVVMRKASMDSVTGRKGKRTCPVCNKGVAKVHRHVLAAHLPWFFNPETACWSCKQDCGTVSKLVHHRKDKECAAEQWPLGLWVANMVALLEELAGMLACQPQNLHLQVQETSGDISPLREVLVEFLEEAQGRKVERVEISPPNCPSAVMVVTSIGPVLARLSEVQRERFLHRDLEALPSFVPAPLELVDAHCHLRQMCQREMTWMCSGWEHVQIPVQGVAAIVNNCVFEGDWTDPPACPLSKMKVVKTVGVHPRLATKAIPWERLEVLMTRKSCVAIGELGLDERAMPEVVSGDTAQHALVRRQLEIAKKAGKPVVMHVRGETAESTRELFGQMLELCQEVGLERQHRMYLHCFTGDADVILKWRSAFPRVMFGIAWRSTQMGNFSDVGRLIPFESFALESDAPYLSPVVKEPNRPQWIVFQAEKLATARNVPVEAIIRRSNMNTRKFYSFE